MLQRNLLCYFLNHLFSFCSQKSSSLRSPNHVRPICKSFFQTLFQTPLPNIFMVPWSQHIRYFKSFVHRRSGVLGIFQKSAGITLLFQGFTWNYTVNQPIHSINDYRCRNFSAGHDIISNRDFIVNVRINNPLVDTFVPSADNYKFVFPTKLLRFFLGKRLSTRRYINNVLTQGLYTIKRFAKRLRHNKLPGATTIRTVITCSVLIKGKIPDIHQIVGNNSLFNRFRHDWGFKISARNLRKQGQHSKFHGLTPESRGASTQSLDFQHRFFPNTLF